MKPRTLAVIACIAAAFSPSVQARTPPPAARAAPGSRMDVEDTQVRTFMAEIYGPYTLNRPESKTWKTWTDRDLYSEKISQLILRWRSTKTEADQISDQDGLCDCQASSGRFAVNIRSLSLTSPGRATVRIETSNGTVGPERLTFSFVKEKGKWRIDDIYWISRNLRMKDELQRLVAAGSVH